MSGNPPIQSGLSNRVQAIILTVSIFLIALPTIAPPDTFPVYVKYILAVIGLAGVALKEGLGSRNV